MSADTQRLTRRQALKGVIALVGGSMTASQLAPLARAAMADDEAAPMFLDHDQFALLERIVDLMIPATDTPGALAAGVHRFIDMMLAEVAGDARRQLFVSALEFIDLASIERKGRHFVELPEGAQFELLSELDREAYVNRPASEPYHWLKQATLFGYYTSEIGASVELVFNPIPGGSPGCVALEPDARAFYKTL